MTELVIAPFADNQFMLRALLAMIAVCAASSTVGTWVVFRGLGFFTDALAHGIVPGVLLSLMFGLNPLLGAAAAAAAMSLGISVVTKRSQFRDDTAIGLLYAGMLALGVTLSTLAPVGTQLESILFGDVLGIGWTDVWTLVFVAVVAAVGVWSQHQRLALSTFSPDKAALLGANPARTATVLLVLVSAVVVASYSIVGSLLIFSLLLAPPATATMLTGRIWLIMLLSFGLGIIAVVCGLLLSFHAGVPGAAAVATVAVGQFAIVLALPQRLRTQ